MKHKLPTQIIFIFLLSSLLFGACNIPSIQPSPTDLPETPRPPQSGAPTVEPTLATLQLSVYPPETRSGNPELDAIIDSVLAHNVVALRTLTCYLIAGCTHANGLGGPPKCEAGEAEGTLVEVVPFLGSEGHHMRRAEYEQWQGPDILGLLTVYRTSSGVYSDEFYPPGEYVLVFLDTAGPIHHTLQVYEGRVVRFDSHPGGTLQNDLAQNAVEVLLPLAHNPIPTAVPWLRFDDSLSRFAFVYPPPMTISEGPGENTWRMGNQIEILIRRPGESWVACFDQALGDCPVVEEDGQVEINGQKVRRVKGWIGAVGGWTPQEFLTYIFDIDGEQLILTVYALPLNTEIQDITTIWPLEGMALELFEQTVETVSLLK